MLFPISSNGAGRSAVPLLIPPGTKGLTAYLQLVLGNTAACGGAGSNSSSVGLGVRIR